MHEVATAGKAKMQSFPLLNAALTELYRPLEKRVTLRLDDDVLAWFKKEGSRRYQTRINSALRRVMELELRRQSQEKPLCGLVFARRANVCITEDVC